MGGLEGRTGLPALQPVPCLSRSCMGILYLSILEASSGKTHKGREESAWLGSGYYYAQMLPSYVVIFANILALITGISTLICMMND